MRMRATRISSLALIAALSAFLLGWAPKRAAAAAARDLGVVEGFVAARTDRSLTSAPVPAAPSW